MKSNYQRGRSTGAAEAAEPALKFIGELQDEILELKRERDEWKQQHENLVEVRRQDIAALAARSAVPAQGEHPDDVAVDLFATAMKAKMAASRAKGRGGWSDPVQCPTERLQRMLVEHLAKGDPVDIGNFAMMLFNRNERTAGPAQASAAEWAPTAKLAADEVMHFSQIYQSADGRPVMTDSDMNSTWNVAAVFRRVRDGVDWRNPVRILTPFDPSNAAAHPPATEGGK